MLSRSFTNPKKHMLIVNCVTLPYFPCKMCVKSITEKDNITIQVKCLCTIIQAFCPSLPWYFFTRHLHQEHYLFNALWKNGRCYALRNTNKQCDRCPPLLSAAGQKVAIICLFIYKYKIMLTYFHDNEMIDIRISCSLYIHSFLVFFLSFFIFSFFSFLFFSNSSESDHFCVKLRMLFY